MAEKRINSEAESEAGGFSAPQGLCFLGPVVMGCGADLTGGR